MIQATMYNKRVPSITIGWQWLLGASSECKAITIRTDGYTYQTVAGMKMNDWVGSFVGSVMYMLGTVDHNAATRASELVRDGMILDGSWCRCVEAGANCKDGGLLG